MENQCFVVLLAIMGTLFRDFDYFLTTPLSILSFFALFCFFSWFELGLLWFAVQITVTEWKETPTILTVILFCSSCKMEKSDTCISTDVLNMSHSSEMLRVVNTFVFCTLEKGIEEPLQQRRDLCHNSTNILRNKTVPVKASYFCLITALPSLLDFQSLLVKTFLNCGFAEVHPGCRTEAVFSEGCEAPRIINRRESWQHLAVTQIPP